MPIIVLTRVIVPTVKDCFSDVLRVASQFDFIATKLNMTKRHFKLRPGLITLTKLHLKLQQSCQR